jgi:hypothetical protein
MPTWTQMKKLCSSCRHSCPYCIWHTQLFTERSPWNGERVNVIRRIEKTEQATIPSKLFRKVSKLRGCIKSSFSWQHIQSSTLSPNKIMGLLMHPFTLFPFWLVGLFDQGPFWQGALLVGTFVVRGPFDWGPFWLISFAYCKMVAQWLPAIVPLPPTINCWSQNKCVHP